MDLIQFEDRIGGLNRASKVLSELIESMDANRLNDVLGSYKIAPAYIQRLGYIVEKMEDGSLIVDALEKYLKSSAKPRQRVPLKPKGKRSGYSVNPRWKIIENMKIDIE